MSLIPISGNRHSFHIRREPLQCCGLRRQAEGRLRRGSAFGEEVGVAGLTDFISVTNGRAVSIRFEGSGGPWVEKAFVRVVPELSGDVSITVGKPGSFWDDALNYNTERPFGHLQDEPAPGGAPHRPRRAGQGDFTVQVKFMEPVKGMTEDDISVTNGTLTSFTPVDAEQTGGYRTTWNAVVTPTADGQVILKVAANAATATDTEKNLATSFTVEADLTRPTVSIGPDATATVSGAFNATITFSEPVSGLEAGELRVTNGTVTSLSAVRPADGPADAPAEVWTARIAPAANGAVTVTLPEGVAADAAGWTNTASAAYSRTAANLARPTVAMKIDLVPPDTNNLKVTDLDFALRAIRDTLNTADITFSKPVTGLEKSDFGVNNGTLDGLVAVNEKDGYASRVGVGIHAGRGGDGNHLPGRECGPGRRRPGQRGGGGRNRPGQLRRAHPHHNRHARLLAAGPRPLHHHRPLLGTGAHLPRQAVGLGQNYLCPGKQPGAFRLRAAGGRGGHLHYDGTEFTVTPPGGETDTCFYRELTFTVKPDTTARYVFGWVGEDRQWWDDGGNIGGHNDIVPQVYFRVDPDPPTVTIAREGDSDPVTGAFNLKLAFNEPVSLDDVSKISVANGTATTPARHLEDEDGSTYVVRVTPASDGAVTYSLAPGSFLDRAGHTHAAAAHTGTASLPPMAVLSTGAQKVSADFAITIAFSEAVTGFEKADLSVTNGVVKSLALKTGSETEYTATITPAVGDRKSNVRVLLPAGKVEDSDGNANPASNTLTVRAVPLGPIPVIDGPAGPVAGPFPVTVRFDKGLTSFTGIETGNGTSAEAKDPEGSPHPHTWYYTITPTDTAWVTVDVPEGAGVDSAGQNEFQGWAVPGTGRHPPPGGDAAHRWRRGSRWTGVLRGLRRILRECGGAGSHRRKR